MSDWFTDEQVEKAESAFFAAIADESVGAYGAIRAALRAVNPFEWMPIDDEARNGNRYPICWKAEGGLSAHVEFGKYGPNKTWLNTYGHAFSIEPDLYFLVPSPEGDK